MVSNQEFRSLVDQMPAPDSKGMYTENIDGQTIETTLAAIYRGGNKSMQLLIDMLDEPGSETDARPHYALHCALNKALIARDEEMRRKFCKTLAANLDGGLSDYNKAYLCQELQWAGGKESLSALGKLLRSESLVEPAAMALVAIGDGAAEQLRAALPEAPDKCRLNILDALAALSDRDSKAAFLAALSAPEREIRLAGGAGLANIGEPDTIAAILKAADVDAGWERTQATKHCVVLAEKLLADGKNEPARKIYQHLIDSRKAPFEAHIRSLAAKALSEL